MYRQERKARDRVRSQRSESPGTEGENTGACTFICFACSRFLSRGEEQASAEKGDGGRFTRPNSKSADRGKLAAAEKAGQVFAP